MEQLSRSQKSQVMSKLQQNEFIPPETLDQFISKAQGLRPAKRLHFDKQPTGSEKKELL
jgi:hypothetical protein